MSTCVTFSIPLLDSLLPDCFPRNSFVLLFGEGGTGKSATLIQMAGEKMRGGEPSVYLTFDDSASSVINSFIRLGYDCNKALEEGKLRIIDCFSFRGAVASKPHPGIWVVNNPKDHHELTGVLRSAVEGISDFGFVFIDSLTEFFTMSEPTSAIETIKNWRAELCKFMNITVLASYHVGVKSIDEYAGMLDYASDGVIDFRFDPMMEQQGLLVRQLRIRKMKGASHGTEWRYFVVEKRGVVELKHHLPKPTDDSQR